MYPEYHTSADDISLVRVDKLAESLRVARMIALLDANRRCVNLRPKGEPRLGKRGLYGTVGATEPGQFERALLWVLSLADGAHDLIATAERSGLSFELIDRVAAALASAGLVRASADSQDAPAKAVPKRCTPPIGPPHAY